MKNVIDTLRLLVVHMGRKQCGTDWNYSNVCSPFMRIYYILSGAAEIEMEGNIVPLIAGNMYVIPAFTRHSYRCSRQFEHYYIHLYNEAGPHILDDWELPREISGNAADLATIERLATLCPGMHLSHTDPKAYDNNTSLSKRIEINKRRDLATRIESRGLIYLLLSRFLATATLKPYCRDPRIKRLVDYIRNNLSSRLDIDTLSDAATLSKDYLIRLFRKETGVTPNCYINARRIEAAQLRLATENESVKEIAYSLGYADHAYFNRLFKKTTGMTPLQYRQSVVISVS